MTVLIHIGYPKTGSTWFQNQFFPKVHNVSFVPKRKIVEKVIQVNSITFNPFEVRNYFLKKYGNHLIFSAEELSVDGRNFGMRTKEIAVRLKKIFPNAQIIVFIRNQIEIMASRYLEYIKAGGNYNIDGFLWRGNKELFVMKDFPMFQYDTIIQHYQELFSANKVHVYLYEDFKTKQNEILEKIRAQFQLNININELNLKTIENPSLRTGLIPLTRFLNSFSRRRSSHKYYIFHIPYFFEATRYLIHFANQFSIFGKTPDSKKLLGENNILIIKNYFKSSNQTLIDKFGFDEIKNYGYPL